MAPPYHFHQTGSGVLRITGEDRLDFIQRQSTNDLAELQPGAHLATVLTNPAARILDVLRMFETDPESYTLLTLPGRGAETAHFLKRRIFFNDRVRLEDLSEQHVVLAVFGDPANGAHPFGAAVPAGAVAQLDIGGAACRILGIDDVLGRGRLVISPREQLDEVRAALAAAGGVESTADEIERMRIERGVPGNGELSEDFTPLETGLRAFISDTKGCYTGQEVIARQITYDKVTKRLAGIRLSRPAETGAQVRADAARIGSLTSVVESPDLGWIGLAVLKRPFDRAGTEVSVQNEAGESAATVVDLPFKPA